MLLTTHYMVEADELCDRVAIINAGRVLACDTPSRLKRRLQQEPIFHVETTIARRRRCGGARVLPGVRKATHHATDGRSSVELVLQEERVLGPVIGLLETSRIGLINLTKREPTLEDVFVDLVGRSMEEVEHGQSPIVSVVGIVAVVERATGWRLFVRTVAARAYPRLIMNVREKWWLVFDIVLPLIGLCAYVFMYRANNAPAELIGFVIIGGAVSAYWMNVLWAMGNQLFWEKETGNLALYIMAPNSMMAILLGMALGGMVGTTVRALGIVLIGSLLFDVQFAVSSVPLLAVVFVLSLVALYGMGMMFASLFLLLGREGWHLVNLAQEPVFLLSGTYFPIRSFNFWVAAGASIIPLTLALDALRQLSFASGAELGFLDVRIEVAVLAGTLRRVSVAAARLSVAASRADGDRGGPVDGEPGVAVRN